jgi:LmbE family N-acetylglucosaminyl deacetylase
MSKTILCIGAHPDDIEIGMGGTVSKLISHGNRVVMVVFANKDMKNIDERCKEAKLAADYLNAEIEIVKISSQELQNNRLLVGKIDRYQETYSPTAVYTHWIHDSHQEHQLIARATISSLRKNKCSLYMYEETIPGGITSHSFQAQFYIDIEDHIDNKINALKFHSSQIKSHNDENIWIYGIKGRAQYRGYQINSKFAEAFQVVKAINNFD